MVTLNYTTLGVSDEVGMAGPSYKFEIENTGNGKISYYEVRIVDKASEISTLPHKSLNFSIKANNNEYTIPSNLGDNDGYVYMGNELEIGDKDTFELKLCVNEEFGKYANNKILRASLEVTLYNETPTRNYVIYDVNGGSGYVPKTSAASKRITSIVPTREGYKFLGWSTNQNAKTPEYLQDAVYNKETGTTFYAVWK